MLLMNRTLMLVDVILSTFVQSYSCISSELEEAQSNISLFPSV